MLLMPDPTPPYIDPFFDETTVIADLRRRRTGRRQVATTATRAPSPSALKPT